MESPPMFSVITVCRNSAATIADAIESLRRQTCADFEWVVIDGGSSDSTVDVARAAGFENMKVVSEPDGGIFSAMNKGLAMAAGQWIFFLNSDDQLHDPDVLGAVRDEIGRDGACDVVYGDAVYTDGRAQRLQQFDWVTPSNLVFGALCHQVVFARRELFGRFGGFCETYRYNADFEWLLRVVGHGGRLRYMKRRICLFYTWGAHVRSRLACERERDEVRALYKSRTAWLVGHYVLRAKLRLRRALPW